MRLATASHQTILLLVEILNVTRAGIHADGLLKDEEIYNIFDTNKVQRRPPRVAVDKAFGTAGVS